MSNVPPPPPPGPPVPPGPYGWPPQEVPGAAGTLAAAIIGLLCCPLGIILGPIAISRSRAMKKRIAESSGVVYSNAGMVQAVFVIGIIATVFGAFATVVWVANIYLATRN